MKPAPPVTSTLTVVDRTGYPGSVAVRTAIVTGSSGLIGSEMVEHLDRRGWRVHGVDNNMRRDFFGEEGDTTSNLERLRRTTERFTHHPLDIRDRDGILQLFGEHRPNLVVHCAAQPSRFGQIGRAHV